EDNIQNILNRDLEIPLYVSIEASDLLSKLLEIVLKYFIIYCLSYISNLQRQISSRLGSGLNESEEIKDHCFFQQIDWKEIINRTCKAPYIPLLNGEDDTTQFHSMYTEQLPVDSPVAESCMQQNKDEFNFDVNIYCFFYGFTYVDPSLIDNLGGSPSLDYTLNTNQEVKTNNSSSPSLYYNVTCLNSIPDYQPRIVQANHRGIDQSTLFDACPQTFNNNFSNTSHALTSVNSCNILNQNENEMMEMASTSSIPPQI
ncbi:ribosomal protein S6 kinase beta-2-like, partial [Aphis craccivora]